jgi:hypothetical protein
MILQGIYAPGAGYDHYSIETPVGSVAILTPMAIGAATPWIALFVYLLRGFRRRERTVQPQGTLGRKEDRG